MKNVPETLGEKSRGVILDALAIGGSPSSWSRPGTAQLQRTQRGWRGRDNPHRCAITPPEIYDDS